ncbi:6-hydroxymethyl-7,8-dihydropterin pyrophosphokinase [Methanobrevibacter sp. 87.7]|uniref:6-hydroxymethylpterin diphosphokinase MptE-like protein n=1 Tax=Methanobrevibacter sp. 87.7 TaxID=387957 RepID=UPI000B50DAD8|nr:6-hydroxymethylpterin diphosphokinase MptE-like protein [Methanobrevibacter sp. 87.7]OWT32436.1 6-hydroxymethyl-7,8-dihydropterin pyrophosphokinase [Methanobrevibacter sp. 87.7]
MKFAEWELWYNKILDDFNFNRDDDESSAKLLNRILDEEGCLNLDDLKNDIVDFKNTNKFIIFGAGPSIKEHIEFIKNNYNLDDYILVSADGSTTALLEEHIVPDIVATDLDGNIDDLLAVNCRDSYMVIHAHGNNKKEIERYTSFFDNILGTTQSTPFGHLYNFGGFTDGDRAMFLSLALGAESLTLAGMDFGNIVTKYSRPKNKKLLQDADDIKKKKLVYAEQLTNWIKDNTDVKLVNLCD